MKLPYPHPLDFDWRYSDITAGQVAGLLHEATPVLAVGAPTVARVLEAQRIAVTLLDRQPIQGVTHHVIAEVTDFVSERAYGAAVVDPPWYPHDLLSWTITAARAVRIGGKVFVSIWPENTRPSAQTETQTIISQFSQWALVRRNVLPLLYEVPLFEITAAELGKDPSLSRSPRYGELIELTTFRLPSKIARPSFKEEWVRFTVDEYQIAVRKGNVSHSAFMEPIPSADGWQWPFVSARAPSVDEIDIWSSDGEVGKIGSSEQTIQILRKAFSTINIDDFETTLSHIPPLLAWKLPRPPFRRSIEWLHQR